MLKTVKFKVNGRVQGVGFRPFIFHLAEKYHLYGIVQNNMDGVKGIIEGEEQQIENMINEIKENPPRLSRIDKVITEEVDFYGYSEFLIIPSERFGKSSLVIPVDSAVCDDCLEEMRDSRNFRYGYPFINCTQCGPRYTIINELPYDRPYTSMNGFLMCEICKKEYEDPRNRRHHAQPIACPDCGPTVKLISIDGSKITEGKEAIQRVKELLAKGFIVAIKGLGGYHLACDALNYQAIANLRNRKKRPNRPLAMMASSIDIARNFCYISAEEEKIMKSHESPIVVLRQKDDNTLPNTLAPGLKTLGIMLPYTPLHYLLFDDNTLKLLVMTSANPSGMPILYKDDQALFYLNGIADFILTTNRDILHPLDDSVLQLNNGQPYFFRRSRGYVPDPINTSINVDGIIAVGAQQKNTFAIGRNKQIFIGPHIGDMNNLETINFFNKELEHLIRWMGIKKEKIVMDKHPNYSTLFLVNELEYNIVYVQHHHAHHVSCMVDNNIIEPCYGIILDGTGYGDDGNIWGFEIIYGDAKSFRRLAHLKYTPLPGGDKAVIEPWRNAVGMIIGYLGEDGKEFAKKLFTGKEREIDIIDKMIKNNINTPLAGTSGRLFDAISAILGICNVSTYDGEAAIRLSEMMPIEPIRKSIYKYMITEVNNIYEISFSNMIREIVGEVFNNSSIDWINQGFHNTLVSAINDVVNLISNNNPSFNKKVVLSGGSFHNPYLLKEISSKLAINGFKVYSHKKVPCNDGGLALGQLIIAAHIRS